MRQVNIGSPVEKFWDRYLQRLDLVKRKGMFSCKGLVKVATRSEAIEKKLISEKGLNWQEIFGQLLKISSLNCRRGLC